VVLQICGRDEEEWEEERNKQRETEDGKAGGKIEGRRQRIDEAPHKAANKKAEGML